MFYHFVILICLLGGEYLEIPKWVTLEPSHKKLQILLELGMLIDKLEKLEFSCSRSLKRAYIFVDHVKDDDRTPDLCKQML